MGGVVFGSNYLAQRLSEANETTQKTILDSMAALLLIELANLEVDGKVKIPDAERERIVQSALSLKTSKTNGNGEVLKLSQVEVAATANSLVGNPQQPRGTEKFWVLDRLSGRVFVGLAEGTYDIKLMSRNGESPSVELNTRALIEITAKDTPVTYQTALAKFRSIEKVNGK